MKDTTRRALTIFGATSISAFWVNAAGHAWKLWRGDPLVRDHKATLQYRSALIGDSTLLPLVNVLLDRQLVEWDASDSPRPSPRPSPSGGQVRPGHMRRGRLARALVAGAGITGAFHVYQAAQKLTNWTMPRPWRWNAFGYYHALYMASQFSLLAYFCGAAGAKVRDRGLTVLLTRYLLAASLSLIAFAALLYKDYY